MFRHRVIPMQAVFAPSSYVSYVARENFDIVDIARRQFDRCAAVVRSHDATDALKKGN